jgi:hypothetical protein
LYFTRKILLQQYRHFSDMAGGRGCPVLGAKRTSQPRASEPRVKKPETGAYPGCSASSRNSLQPQILGKSAEILPTFQRAFFNLECASSNPPRSANQSYTWRLCSHKSHKLPPVAGFCELATGLQTPISLNSEAKMPIVSGGVFNIPVFGRPRSETGFDRYCVADAAV